MKKYVLYKSSGDNGFAFFEEGDSTNMHLLEDDMELIWSVEAESFDIAMMKEREFLGWEPYKPLIANEIDLRNYLPKDKHDVDNVQLLINLGYPEVKLVIPELFEWIQDMNWPVAKIIAPFLASIGKPLIPYTTAILEGDDCMWKYWTLVEVINRMNKEEILTLEKELFSLAKTTNSDDIGAEVNLVAKDILINKLGMVL